MHSCKWTTIYSCSCWLKDTQTLTHTHLSSASIYILFFEPHHYTLDLTHHKRGGFRSVVCLLTEVFRASAATHGIMSERCKVTLHELLCFSLMEMGIKHQSSSFPPKVGADSELVPKLEAASIANEEALIQDNWFQCSTLLVQNQEPLSAIIKTTDKEYRT